MAVHCPYCERRIHFKAMPPGEYRPDCSMCLRPFALSVPELTGAPWRSRRLSHHAYSALDARPRHSAADAASTHSTRSLRPALASGRGDDGEPAPTNPDLRAASPHKPLARIGRPTPTAAHASPAPPSTSGEAASGEADDAHPPPPADIRGYRIERVLGRGGMGSVYLARQLSLGRWVALKVMGQKWSTDPVFVARFTREAYAAAQLSHPNIVAIHDIGEAEGIQFFSMEYVPGESLADLVRREGKIDPEAAVNYVLQAARGLKHAHDRGMIHRDVKPDNLLIDGQGVVKVADLGLVKTWEPERGALASSAGAADDSGTDLRPADLNLTGARIALGTPAYMSPEQCRDAAAVDHRADIYSLGCTLYVLVTGRPPFDGNTAVELMTKHAYQPLVPPEHVAARVPKELSAVIQRMMAKDASERFPDMGDVVRTLEAWLGVRHAGSFTPCENQIGRLETFVQQFHSSPTAVLRSRALGGFFSTLGLAVVLLAFFGQLTWSFGLVALGVQSSLAYFVLDGVARKGHLFRRVRQLLWGLSWGDWVVGSAGLVLFGVLLGLLDALSVWCGFGLIGVGLAIGLRFGLDRTIEAERAGPLRACERLMMRMRRQGLGEDELRQFAAKFAGRHWEEPFECLFGFEAKLAARAILLRGEAAGPRERHAAWREPILHAVERIERGRREARERRLLQVVEQANLMAFGLAADPARERAATSAAAMVRRAGRVRGLNADAGPNGEPARRGRIDLQRLVTGAEATGTDRPAPPAPGGILDRLCRLLVGPHVRLGLALALFAACALWARPTDAGGGEIGRVAQSLVVEGVPAAWTAWADGWHVAAAGTLLLASLFHRGNLAGAFALLGAAVVVAGPRYGIRSVEPFRDVHVALMLGSVLALVGFRLGQR